ncbi:MAG: class I SAM-dependent methyltransferase [Candidatus Omnitrophica bacterium]|nr:class I SAM-dependent methyltransferase [Candidatus Omnitrophota bacterium]
MGQELKRTSGRTLDHVAHVYDLLSPLMLFGLEARMSRPCLGSLEDPSIRSVLDMGCGTGTLTIEAAEKLSGRPGSLVVGMDAAPKMIDVARRKAAGMNNLRFDVGIAEELPYPRQSFDGAISTFFFHHIERALKEKALNELWRVLKNGRSALVIDVDVPTNIFGKICAWSGYYLFQQDEIRENIHGELRASMEASLFRGYEIVRRHQGYISVFKLNKQGGM